MNLTLHRFITNRLRVNNDPISIEECIEAVKAEFDMSYAGATTAVERVLQERVSDE